MEPSPPSAPLHEVDHDLIRRAQRGDIVALNRLISELSPFVGRVCRGVAGANGEDAMQNTLISMTAALPTLREPDALHGWVRQIAVRESVRVARRASRTPLVAEPDTWVADPADPLGALDDRLKIREVLDAMEPEHRAVVVLRDLEGLSEAEVATALDMPVGTVKSRLHRGRASFRQRWGG